MDDTQQSRVSDAAAAATRKRRSSILKSQRPARTPFSELEFNVATPTDTAKSRRVSFSRRTGVAEFVTNEATTTWKNFYEEHNKSLESSNNDSEANASRQPVGHLGKRIFDQQFEEVEAVDFISGFATGSLNNVNFSQHLGSFECTGEEKLTAPHSKFELSAFTERSKPFGNDFTAPSIGENSCRIDVDFSAIQQFEKDYLDEIEKDLGRRPNKMGCHGPFNDGQNMSEYIEVDLNMTHVVKNDEDMSITDTVHSPLKDVSKSASIEKKVSLNNDWFADKENIAINPYAAPCESNFAGNEDPDQVLVFDGKRLTLQADKPEKDKNYRQTLLPDSSAETPQRKTIVLNVNDDLPNFIDDMLHSKCENSGFNGFQERKTIEDEISDTVSDIKSKTKTMHDNTGNISMTQALPTNIICQTAVISHDVNATKRRTNVINETISNISVTEPVPVKLLSSGGTMPERRHTSEHEDDTGNISITQAVPTNILVNENLETPNKNKTIVFDSDKDNISITQAISSNMFEEASRRKTIVFDVDADNVSFTQALPANIMLPDKQTQEKRRTIIYENDTRDISVTQAVPTNIILPNNETNSGSRRTFVYEHNTGNIPTSILQERVQLDDNKENNEADKISTQSIPDNSTANDSDPSRRKTVVFEIDTGNISIAQSKPTQLITGNTEDKPFDAFDTSRKPRNRKRTTIIYDNDEGDISMTEAIPANIIEETTNERKTIVYNEDEASIISTLAISTNVFLLDRLDSLEDCIIKSEEIKEVKEKVIVNKQYEQDAPNVTRDGLQDHQKSTVFNTDGCNSDMSKTTAIPKVQSLRETEKRTTLNLDNENCDISVTKTIPVELTTFGNELLHKSMNMVLEATQPDKGANPQSDVIILRSSTNSKPSLHLSTSENGDFENILGDVHRNGTSDSKEASSVNITDDVIPSLEEVSATASLLHPRLEQKLNKFDLITSEMNEDKVSEGEYDVLIQTDTEEKNISVLPSLLTISVSSVDDGTEDKNFMACIESNPSSDNLNQDADVNTSDESMFYITKDSDYDPQIDIEANNERKRAKPKELTYAHPPTLHLEYKEEEPVQIDNLQMKLAELQAALSEKNDFSNRLFEEAVSSDLQDIVGKDENIKYRKECDTQKLLDMITTFTNSKDGDNGEPPVKIKEVTEHKRLSLANNRQSIALSREDLLNNISMAQAALQKSRQALDDSDCHEDDETRDASVDISKKSGRTSKEVVKTLQFDDESINETSLKFDSKYSPLKKTVFGETSYMNETKGNVIPTYLKNVSDGIKELMLDLIKPMNDTLPFDSITDKGIVKITSTHSTQVQANLLSSSQIDLDCELFCNTDTNTGTQKGCSLSSTLNRSISRCLQNPINFSGISPKMLPEFDVPPQKQRSSSPTPVKPAPPDVLVFDHMNPLNNILLAPINYSGVHRYNPEVPDDPLYGNERSRSNGVYRDNDYEVETVTTTQHCMAPRKKAMQEDVYVNEKQDDQFSMQSKSSNRPMSIDQSTGDFATQLKDDQVNTLIAMKGNKELLEASSSLTLVDDALDSEGRSLSPSNEYDNRRIRFSRSNLVDIEERAVEIENAAKSTESALSDRTYSTNSLANRTKGKKRNFSPSTDKIKQYQVMLEVSPTPITKIKKMSSSPQSNTVAIVSNIRDKDIELTSFSTDESTNNFAPKIDVIETSERSSEQNAHTSKVGEGKSPKAKDTKQVQSITVQQLLTDYHNLDSDFKHISEKQLLEDLNLNPKSGSSTACSQSGVSFTSSKNLKAIKDVNSMSTTDCQSSHQSSARMQSMPSQMDWHPELMCATSKNLCSSDSGVNVVAKIDMLPFMGSHECEWESSSADTWSFRLLHGRLRLSTRLAHRHDNATRTRVRGDTPVLDIAVETVQFDRKNPVATMTVRFACETMRYMLSHALSTMCCARDIPPLLRRCAAVARVALRWGRAMHDAKLHLAYSLDVDGNLSLKVANIPLRSVWEVTMRIDLILDDKHGVPWPRASGVCVAGVVSDVLVPDADVRRLLEQTPRDWGHAPRTIWRIFRYLKHKKRDDHLLLE